MSDTQYTEQDTAKIIESLKLGTSVSVPDIQFSDETVKEITEISIKARNRTQEHHDREMTWEKKQAAVRSIIYDLIESGMITVKEGLITVTPKAKPDTRK